MDLGAARGVADSLERALQLTDLTSATTVTHLRKGAKAQRLVYTFGLRTVLGNRNKKHLFENPWDAKKKTTEEKTETQRFEEQEIVGPG